MPISQRCKIAGILASALFLASCGDKDSSSSTQKNTSPNFELSILHINDHHSHLEETALTLKIPNNKDIPKAKVSAAGFARVASKIKSLEETKKNSIRIHAGDAITGDIFYTLSGYAPDARVMRELCFDIFALGNHEFDDGDQNLADFLQALNSEGCSTDVIAANVKPAIGTPLRPTEHDIAFKPYVIKEFNGHKVGFIGIDIAGKTKESSSPLPTTEFLNEVETAQTFIDELTQQGVNNIVVVSHYQYDNEVKMAKALRNVDVIVGGDSHTLLGDEFKQLGLPSSGSYPTQLTNASGDKVCVVQAWEYAKVVGELDVSFNSEGKVTQCKGTPHLLLGEGVQVEKMIRQEDGKIKPEWVDATPKEQASVIASLMPLSVTSFVTPDSTIDAIVQDESKITDKLKREVIGHSDDSLCIARIPQKAYGTCNPADLPHGSELAEVVAEAFLQESKVAQLAIQNAGGVRENLNSGDITAEHVYKILPFSNTLVNINMTGQDIKDTLEAAIENAIRDGGSDGAYPYAAGIRFNVDLTKPNGKRVSQLEVKPKSEPTYTPIELNTTYKVVANNYIAAGKDGYTPMAKLQAEDTKIEYAQAFYNYIKRFESEGRSITKVSTEDYSTQHMVSK